MDARTYRLTVTLRGSRPAIWRRVEVDADVTLLQLHEILQVVMGWTDSHLHQFRRGSTLYGQSDPELGMHRENERRIRLREVLRKPKDRMIHEYDFGDGWEHDIVVEASDSTTGSPPVVLPIVWFSRRSIQWHWSELAIFVLPFAAWFALFYAGTMPKTPANLGEAFYLSAIIVVAVALRA